MKSWLLGLALVLVMLAGLLSVAPARLLGSVLPAGTASLQGFSGTLWRGSASRVLVRAGPGYLHMGAVEWSLSPLSLLMLSPRLNLESRWGEQMLVGDLVLQGPRDFELRDVSASFSADLVRQLIPVGLQGTLSARFRQLQLRDGLPYSADGRLHWEGAGWQSPAGARPLGNYEVDILQPPGESLEGQVTTLSGPVRADGSLWLRGREYRVDILVRGDGPLEGQLQQALSLVASREGEAFRLSLEGVF